MTPSLIFTLMLFYTLGSGVVEQKELAGPFTNLTACVIVAGIINQRGLTVSIPEDATKVQMGCVGRPSN